ncbi:unnamed protein product, partial [Musa acuminata subsp. burmannicoides]
MIISIAAELSCLSSMFYQVFEEFPHMSIMQLLVSKHLSVLLGLCSQWLTLFFYHDQPQGRRYPLSCERSIFLVPRHLHANLPLDQVSCIQTLIEHQRHEHDREPEREPLDD